MTLRRPLRLLKQTVTEWSADSASSRAAALSYYAALSISPLLIIAISIAGLVFGPDQVRGRVMAQIEDLVGSGGAEVIDSMLRSTNSASGGIIATSLGLGTLLLGAGGVFAELQDALNKFWGVDPPEGSGVRSEEHTSELQSPDHIVCRLLLEKKKNSKKSSYYNQIPCLIRCIEDKRGTHRYPCSLASLLTQSDPQRRALRVHDGHIANRNETT